MAVLKTYFIYRTTFYYIIKIQDFHKMNLLWVFYTKYLQKGLKIDNTGWSISFLYTLAGWYGKNDIFMVKIGVVIFSVHPEISFGNIKSEKIAEI